MRIWMRAGVLNELIYECQRSLEGIANAKIDQEARAWARNPRNRLGTEITQQNASTSSFVVTVASVLSLRTGRQARTLPVWARSLRRHARESPAASSSSSHAQRCSPCRAGPTPRASARPPLMPGRQMPPGLRCRRGESMLCHSPLIPRSRRNCSSRPRAGSCPKGRSVR